MLNPTISTEDLMIYQDAMRCYMDYLRHTGLYRDQPKLYSKVHYANLRLLVFKNELNKQNNTIGIKLDVPRRSF